MLHTLKKEQEEFQKKADNHEFDPLDAVHGIPEEDCAQFKDAEHWLDFFPPKGTADLKAFGVLADWRRSFITTAKNPFFDSFIRW